MTRDKLKEEIVYKEDIEWNEGAISRFKEKIQREKNIDNKEKQENRISAIGDYYFDLLLMHYSIGSDIEIMKPIFIETLKYKAMEWYKIERELYMDNQYFELVTLISLALLLEVSNDEALILMKMRSVVSMHDLVLDFMLKTLLSEEQFEQYSKKFEENSNKDGYEGNVIGGIRPYCHLQTLLELKDKKEQEKFMQSNYLKHWYKRCKEMSFYNQHKADITYYYGYWSFESVAITKILGLDDSSYRDNKYYPKDMLNWRENE